MDPENENVVENVQNTTVGAVPTYSPVSAIINIVVSVLCCTGCVGIVSLVFAILSLVEGSKVKNFVAQNDLNSANASLEKAKKWVLIAWIIAAVAIVISLIVDVIFIILPFLADL